MKRLLALLPMLFALTCVGAEEVLRVDFRERPPEMRAVDGIPSGPLISVLETAAQRIGVRLYWRQAPFLRSLDDLRSGRVDLVPRVLLTEQRREYIHFLPSIGNQQLNIRFVVHPGREAELKRYEDLHRLSVGVKRGTVYFEPFDSDERLTRVYASDDAQLAAMFRAGRLDTIAVLDVMPMEAQFASLGFDDFSYAHYAHQQVLGNHFGASLKRYQSDRRALYDRLSAELERMRAEGEVALIYHRYGVLPPDETN
ncbi:substrate-binding periplasmic protein [Ectopseudomonas guguanensis]|jgi:polar amino acid transport system substrate-binding protein|uniref:Amino acid ABC transporter substrate-binding protein, PAAT family n=1 Tax=Ectopseudomonas guguanensis TaxID=1198456 RepID=A0A1H0WVR4_9GAMM|nr:MULTISPECIES: transporter substrate-binding domain-containing protein [Pseudomonas]MDR8016670.1 transporter substrate-binding domain-containing protein [Pseudomonas guguanensis]MPT19333.1 ABC transporter substrate-binding protein [Pseudomonas sp.]WJH54683.1 ABC transporter substrate-binding protein [Pseudomonas guguanensis]SDP94752.1 amino acid ABC transporter substrate-binding protein, PAAT family [Pseudomonas guguanensis]